MINYMKGMEVMAFGEEIIARIGPVEEIDGMNKWMGLAMNIWNNTPQADRGGKSALELDKEHPGSDYTYEAWRGTAERK